MNHSAQKVRPLIAINLDSADISRINSFIEAGYLPNLAQFKKQSAHGELDSSMDYLADSVNVNFLTGCTNAQTRFWGVLRYSPQDYTHEQKELYDFQEFPPFYDHFKNTKIALYNLPYSSPRKIENTESIQICGWGTHGPERDYNSYPKGIVEELVEQFGEHPMFNKDSANMLDPDSIWSLCERTIAGIEHDQKAISWIYEKKDWDVFMLCFSGLHSTGHFVEAHPHWSTPENREKAQAWLIRIYQKLDEAIGKLLAQFSPKANVLIYSLESMKANYHEAGATVLLPELMYRMHTGGNTGIDFPSFSEVGAHDWSKAPYWKEHISPWLKRPTPVAKWLRKRLSPRDAVRWERRLGIRSVPFSPRHFKSLSYQIAKWYEPLWPEMEAYALPSFFESHIRINVKGRESKGIIPADKFQEKCDQIVQTLNDLIDLKTNQPAVESVKQTRHDPMDTTRGNPHGDLLVHWKKEMSSHLESPTFGRLGPCCPPRNGIHGPEGLMMLRSPDVEPNNSFSGTVFDLPPTLLALRGVEKPDYMTGESLLN